MESSETYLIADKYYYVGICGDGANDCGLEEQHKQRPRGGRVQCYQLYNVKSSLAMFEELELGLRSRGGNMALSFQALKMAHAGILLSEQEASVASPFTLETANIECASHLIK
ncbi:hypothetical protein J1605_008293 [Eschrichtius robustus]|uniref:Uncharacterized protein n=1 Tax=Eschrichtius robustus TaxID=9764 RepID=A0AB34GY98_ESCRO|nr:hypothetical protein J1605_008293 [Eschrichtius robustus]